MEILFYVLIFIIYKYISRSEILLYILIFIIYKYISTSDDGYISDMQQAKNIQTAIFNHYLSEDTRLESSLSTYACSIVKNTNATYVLQISILFYYKLI